jgi:hypothetical protein
MAQATVKQVKEYFDTTERPMKLAEMRIEWVAADLPIGHPQKLTDEDKTQIMDGIGDGSFTY